MAKKSDAKGAKIPVIGLLAFKNQLITKEELAKAMEECSGAADLDTALKDYFLSNELVSTKNIQRLSRAGKALATRKKEFQFGAIAVKKGFINKSVLKLALDEQANAIKKKKKLILLGDLLREAGMLTAKQCDYIYKLQQRVVQATVHKVEQGEEKHEEQDENTLKEDTVTPQTQISEELSQDAKEEPAKEKIDSPSNELPEDDDIQESSADENGLMEPVVLDGGIQLEISQNLMAAFITKTRQFNQNISVTEIKENLFDQGIVLGLEEDKAIEGFIESSGFKTQAFMVAKGTEPIEGQDAKIEFFFNTDYLKAGGMTEDGTIDFKDRGNIPHVEEGTVLAEKIPMVESRNGFNVYGDELETTPGRDITLNIGKGAKLSEDGYKIIAAVNGFPKYTLAGQIFVHQEYTAEGDVDYETGHINYDGNVKVKGRIKAGFNVKCNDVIASELDGGSIDADGNVNIQGGINEGTIYSRGSVFAKFIHKSEITCMGDLVVQKEVVDSDIKCSGGCNAQTGKLISSRVSAKMGIKAKNIGSEMAAPNSIQVARDPFLEVEMDKNDKKTEALVKKLNEHKAKKEELEKDNLELQKEISDLAHVQDRSQLEEREINSQIASLNESSGDSTQIEQLKQKVEQLKTSAQKAEQDLDTCFEKSEKNEEIIEAKDRQIEECERSLNVLKNEKQNLMNWSRDNPGKAEVIATGSIAPGTIIKGKHSEKRIDKLTSHVRFSEVLSKTDDGELLNIYEIQAGNI